MGGQFSLIGPESYDRDLRYRHGLLSTTISLRRDIMT